jgi:hypothetical protein
MVRYEHLPIYKRAMDLMIAKPKCSGPLQLRENKNTIQEIAMNEETRRTSLFLPIVILTAIALALYLLVVWDPIGIYGSVRQYLEHSIRAPLEWIVLFLALSWIIQHDLIYYLIAIFLLPFFLLILWLSSPDGGVWFWRMFTQEIYLPPVYIPRGFLLYVFSFNAGMARHVPLPELAADVANAMYQYDMRDYDQLPRAWRSRNWQRRIEAFRNRIRAENDFMQELERNIRLREQSSMNRR